ncbi:MAG: hypothetical protein QME32_05720 [Endomicrobiia bacterium]|nr:hypothetical protein [Endomicrobiia bacterium]
MKVMLKCCLAVVAMGVCFLRPVFADGQEPDITTETMFLTGVGRFLEGDTTSALSLLEIVVDRNPADADKKSFYVKVALERVSSLTGWGDYSGALAAAANTMRRAPDDKRVAEIHGRLKNMAAASEKLAVPRDETAAKPVPAPPSPDGKTLSAQGRTVSPVARPPRASAAAVRPSAPSMSVPKILSLAAEAMKKGEFARAQHLAEAALIQKPADKTAIEISGKAAASLSTAREEFQAERERLITSLMTLIADLNKENAALLRDYAVLKSEEWLKEEKLRRMEATWPRRGYFYGGVMIATAMVIVFVVAAFARTRPRGSSQGAPRDEDVKVAAGADPLEYLSEDDEESRKFASLRKAVEAGDVVGEEAFGLSAAFLSSENRAVRIMAFRFMVSRYPAPKVLKALPPDICDDHCDMAAVLRVMAESDLSAVGAGEIDALSTLIFRYIDHQNPAVRFPAMKILRGIVESAPASPLLKNVIKARLKVAAFATSTIVR